jgi:hypothetical protein
MNIQNVDEDYFKHFDDLEEYEIFQSPDKKAENNEPIDHQKRIPTLPKNRNQRDQATTSNRITHKVLLALTHGDYGLDRLSNRFNTQTSIKSPIEKKSLQNTWELKSKIPLNEDM